MMDFKDLAETHITLSRNIYEQRFTFLAVIGAEYGIRMLKLGFAKNSESPPNTGRTWCCGRLHVLWVERAKQNERTCLQMAGLPGSTLAWIHSTKTALESIRKSQANVVRASPIDLEKSKYIPIILPTGNLPLDYRLNTETSHLTGSKYLIPFVDWRPFLLNVELIWIPLKIQHLSAACGHNNWGLTILNWRLNHCFKVIQPAMAGISQIRTF